MATSTAKMTVRLPDDDLAIARQYASRHGLSLTGLVVRYFESLRCEAKDAQPAEIAAVAGTVPMFDVVRDDYIAAMEAKHS